MIWPLIAAIGTAVGVAGQLSAAEDAEDAYNEQARISRLNAEHQRKVAEFNANIFKENAARLRTVQTGRLVDTASLNISRLMLDRDVNIGRLQEGLDINSGRLLSSTGLNLSRIEEDTSRTVYQAGTDFNRYIKRVAQDRSLVMNRANQDFGTLSGDVLQDEERQVSRTTEVANEVIRRLGRQATETAVRGFEQENDFRKEVVFRVSQQRAFYAAGNVVVSTGTPAMLQLDTVQQGEMQARRIRRDYRIQVQDLQDRATDTMRDALYRVEDIRSEAARAVRDLGINRDRLLQDADIEAAYRGEDLVVNRDRAVDETMRESGRQTDDLLQTTAYQLGDLYREAGYQIDDINFETDTRIQDTETRLGYDLSDNFYEADVLDHRALLTLMQGDAAFAAGINMAAAQEQAGSDARFNGVVTAIGNGIAGVSSIWYSPESAGRQPAPVVESEPTFVR